MTCWSIGPAGIVLQTQSCRTCNHRRCVAAFRLYERLASVLLMMSTTSVTAGASRARQESASQALPTNGMGRHRRGTSIQTAPPFAASHSRRAGWHGRDGLIIGPLPAQGPEVLCVVAKPAAPGQGRPRIKAAHHAPTASGSRREALPVSIEKHRCIADRKIHNLRPAQKRIGRCMEHAVGCLARRVHHRVSKPKTAAHRAALKRRFAPPILSLQVGRRSGDAMRRTETWVRGRCCGRNPALDSSSGDSTSGLRSSKPRSAVYGVAGHHSACYPPSISRSTQVFPIGKIGTAHRPQASPALPQATGLRSAEPARVALRPAFPDATGTAAKAPACASSCAQDSSTASSALVQTI